MMFTNRRKSSAKGGFISFLRPIMAVPDGPEGTTIHVDKVKDYFRDAADRRRAAGEIAAAR
jgi:hypothetical protein